MASYVGVSPGDILRNAPLLRLFFDSLINVNTSKTPDQDPTLTVPALLLLDEFAQLGRMDRLAHALQYGSYAATDEKRMGDATVNVVTQNRPRWFSWMKPAKQSEAEHPHRRPLMLRQEILQMPPDEQLILRPGMKPIRAKKIQWWREPEFVRRRLRPPVIPQLTVEIPMDDLATRLRQVVPAPIVPAEIGEC